MSHAPSRDTDRPLPAAGAASRGRLARLRLPALLGVLALAATGCSNERPAALRLPQADHAQGERVLPFWQGSVIAALVVGVFVWGLIFWCVIAYRKNSDELPRQVRYNLPIEILYTVVPLIIIGVLFYYTAVTRTTRTSRPTHPGLTVGVIGYKWNWRSTTRRSTAARPAGQRPRGRAARAGAAHRHHDQIRRELARRHPLVLGALVPVQAGRHPGPRQPVRADHHQAGRVHRPLRRAVRRRPRPDELRGARADQGRLRRQWYAKAVRLDHRACPRTPPCLLLGATRDAPYAISGADRRPTRPSPASPAGSSSAGSPPPTTS